MTCPATCGAVHPNGRHVCDRAPHWCGRHSIDLPQSGMYRHTVVVTWPHVTECPQPDYSEVVLWP